MALHKREINTCNNASRMISIWVCFAHFALIREDNEQKYFNTNSDNHLYC